MVGSYAIEEGESFSFSFMNANACTGGLVIAEGTLQAYLENTTALGDYRRKNGAADENYGDNIDNDHSKDGCDERKSMSRP